MGLSPLPGVMTSSFYLRHTSLIFRFINFQSTMKAQGLILCLSLASNALAEVQVMEGVSDLNVDNSISDAVAERFYPGWRNDTASSAHRLSAQDDPGALGSFNFVVAGITVVGYYGFQGFKEIALARAACRSRGTAEDGTFACINAAAATTCRHGSLALASGFGLQQVVDLLTSSGEGQEETKKPGETKRSCAITSTYSTDYSFSSSIEIKNTGFQACTLFPKSYTAYLGNIWSQMGEIAFAENSALYIQWTMFDGRNGDVWQRWHSEIDTAPTDICPLYVSGSGCKR